MRTPGHWFFLIIAGVMLAGCGGSTGSSAPSTGVTVTPSGTQVLAGAAQQMQAKASDGGQTFNWQVNGTAGGNSNLGTISATGLYTAPKLPPPGGTVKITASEQGGAGASGSATLSIGFSNASLSGGYVFNLNGRNQGTPWSGIGEFSANGAGQLQNGLEDTNNGVSVQTKSAFDGGYAINPDGSGTLTLGNLELQLVMQANGGAVLLSKTNGTVLTGALTAQAASAGGVVNFAAPLVLNAGGQSGNQNYAELALISTANNGTLAGYQDVSGFTPLIRAPWNGRYNFDGNNHGSLTIGNQTYSFYVISATDCALLSDTAAVTASGRLRSQTAGTYSNAALSGGYVFWLSGSSATQAYAQAGQINPNGSGNLGTVTEDLNMPGNLKAGFNTVGTYVFDNGVNGRGTLTLNNQGTGAPQSYVFYMLSPQAAEIITSNSSFVGSGRLVMQPQNNSFDDSAYHGAYSFAFGAQLGTANISAAIGMLNLDGNGKLDGTLFQNLNGSMSPALSLSGSYALNGGVRGTATLTSNGGGSSAFAVYPINANEFVLIGTDPAGPYLGLASNGN